MPVTSNALQRAVAAIEAYDIASHPADVRRFAPLRTIGAHWTQRIRDGVLSPEAALQIARLPLVEREALWSTYVSTGRAPSVRDVRAIASENTPRRAPRNVAAAPSTTSYATRTEPTTTRAPLSISAHDASQMSAVCASITDAINALPRAGSCHEAFAARLNELLDEATNYTEATV